MNHSSCVTPVVDGNTLYWQGVEYVRVALGEDGPGQTLYEFGTPEWWASAITSGMLVLCAGLVAGLTMGFVSLDATYIDIQCKTGSPAEKRRAMKLRWFAHHHHLVLVTLLLGNSLCNEALPIFLHHIVNEVVSIILSVTLILFFGEIIPSAIFTGPSQMKIGKRHWHTALAPAPLRLCVVAAAPMNSLGNGVPAVGLDWFVLHSIMANQQAP